MGIFFTVGEKKKRPGVYQRYENVGGVSIAGATDGIVACCIRSNWGELNKVHTFESIEQAKLTLGNGGENGTVSLLTEIFTGICGFAIPPIFLTTRSFLRSTRKERPIGYVR